MLVICLALTGSFLAESLSTHWIAQPTPGVGGAFFNLFGRFEMIPQAIIAVFAVLVMLYLAIMGPHGAHRGDTTLSLRPLAWMMAVLVLLVCAAGTQVVMHGYPLSMDEFNAVFQSEIFRSGRISAPVPAEWQGLISAIKPIFVTYRPDDHVWLSSYLPVYAALRACFLLINLDQWLNPLLAGCTVLAVAAASKRLWGTGDQGPLVAVVLLAASSQFLLMSMSYYAMPAHLLLNACWLVVYLRGGSAALAAPWIGILALGLHNPFPHALFVAPFLIRMLRQHQLRRSLYYGLVYAFGSAVWLTWWRYALPATTQAGLSDLFGLPNTAHLITEVLSLALAMSWQTPTFALFLGVAILSWRRLGPVERDLAWGLGLTLGFYFFFMDTQGHGWGYRYVYPVLGSATLLAARGLVLCAQSVGASRIYLVFSASLVVTLTLQLPIRARDAEAFVDPFARSMAYIRSLKADAVVIPTEEVWYGYDLVRGDPFFRTPILIGQPRDSATAATLEGLVGVLDERLILLEADQLRRFGMATLEQPRRRELRASPAERP